MHFCCLIAIAYCLYIAAFLPLLIAASVKVVIPDGAELCGMQPSAGGVLAADLSLSSVCSKMYYIILPSFYVPAPIVHTATYISFAYLQGKTLGILSIGCGEHSHYIKLHIQYYTIL